MIIGLSGSFGSGKTTRGEYLYSKLEEMGKDVVFINFADSLKQFLCEHLRVHPRYFRTTSGKSEYCAKYNMTYGKVLQLYGEGMRKIDTNFWIDKLESQICDMQNAIIIIGDVRYQNELNWIISKGGIVFKKDGIRKESIAGRDLIHPSEQKLVGYNRIFSNDSSVKDDVDVILSFYDF